MNFLPLPSSILSVAFLISVVAGLCSSCSRITDPSVRIIQRIEALPEEHDFSSVMGDSGTLSSKICLSPSNGFYSFYDTETGKVVYRGKSRRVREAFHFSESGTIKQISFADFFVFEQGQTILFTPEKVYLYAKLTQYNMEVYAIWNRE